MNSTYSASGVNIPAGRPFGKGEKFVEKIKPLVKSTFSRQVLSSIGNFGAFFRIPDGYREPVFVSSTDGVGTKLKIAIALNKHDTIGEDIVNHSVNDIAVCGATPLFFLDYLAFGKLNYKTATKIIEGLIRGCKRNNCSLIGGETAEMPDIYKKTDYDIAGTVVGIVDKKKIIDKKNVRAGDVLIGLKSNGLHTNGYTLARKVLLTKFKLTGYLDELGTTLGEELLKVHRTYLKIIQSLINKFKISSVSHITGGGIVGNTKRVVPDNLKIKIDWNSWQRNPIFSMIQRTGNVSENGMRRVFNLGIGLVLIVRKESADKISEYLKSKREKHFLIGEISK